jgi:gamma-glutamyltranspeptidase/glutathione hydrolase
VVATDAEGNVAAVTHTINTALFGGTGINVGGISIPDAACFQQDLIRRVGPGVRLPDPTNPIIVMKDGRWVLAGSSIGAGLLENTLTVLVNVLDYGRDPDAALHAPQFSGGGLQGPQVLPTDDFSEAVVAALNARGGHAILQPKQQVRASFGSWISIQRDPKTGRLRGATRDLYNGAVEAY